MDTDSRTEDQGNDQERDRGDILRRIEEKLDRLLRPREDDWPGRKGAPLEAPPGYPGAGEPSAGFFGGPPPDAPGWDPSIAGRRFDRLDVGAVGTHGVAPVSSFDGSQPPPFGAHSSAREYYLLSRAKGGGHAGGDAGGYAEYRRRKEAELDREYADYCRDQQERFDRDFDSWRRKRGQRRQSGDEHVGNEETAGQDNVQAR